MYAAVISWSLFGLGVVTETLHTTVKLPLKLADVDPLAHALQPDGVSRFSSLILSEISAMIRASVSPSHGTPDSLVCNKNCCLSSISFATFGKYECWGEKIERPPRDQGRGDSITIRSTIVGCSCLLYLEGMWDKSITNLRIAKKQALALSLVRMAPSVSLLTPRAMWLALRAFRCPICLVLYTARTLHAHRVRPAPCKVRWSPRLSHSIRTEHLRRTTTSKLGTPRSHQITYGTQASLSVMDPPPSRDAQDGTGFNSPGRTWLSQVFLLLLRLRRRRYLHPPLEDPSSSS